MSLPENEQPVTRGHFDEFRGHFDESLKSIRDEISQLATRLERAETTLLSGFHSYARSEGVRSQALEIRLHEVEQRVLKIEEHLGAK